MKKVYLFPFLILSSFFIVDCSAQTPGEWMWIHGTNTYNDFGNMGVQGVPSPANQPPALYEPCEWTDLNGNFWMYGGLDDNSGLKIHNDLWKYDPTSNQWTWMNGANTYNDHGNFGVKGVSSPTNRAPGLGYGVATWVDLAGNLWMFGGWNDSAYADLWKYDIGINQWTWVNGPGTGNAPGIYGTIGVPNAANYPPARDECSASWTDNAGDLWLFGGYSGLLFNDLWRYNIATNTWTWMKGSNLTNQKGVWGTKGVEAPANTPSSRRAYCHWKDNVGNLWTFGGGGFDSLSNYWQLNDLWRFNPVTNNWTWMNGPNTGTPSNIGVYGTKCVSNATNLPPPRYESRAVWTDQNGNFWVFSGQFQTSPFNTFTINDLWKYCVSSNEWTWEGGDNTPNQVGNWGTKGVSSPTNKPSPRMGCPGWTDNKGHLYTFGGTSGAFGTLTNDLWVFAIDTTCTGPCATVTSTIPVPSFQSTDTTFCAGSCIDYHDLSSNNPTSWNWSFPGALPSSSNAQNPQGICYLSAGSYNVTLVAANSGGSNTVTVTNFINVFASPPTPTITCSNDTLYSSVDPSYTSYQWYNDTTLVLGATNSYYVINHSGSYNVAVKNANGCSIAVGINTNGCLAAMLNYSGAHTIAISPNPASDQILIKYSSSFENTNAIITNVLGEQLLSVSLPKNQDLSIDVKTLAAGIYFLHLFNEKGTWVGKFVKE